MNTQSPDEAVYALSPIQQGMLYQVLADPNTSANIEQLVLSVDEHLDETAFVTAWAKLVERYDILRTRFEWSGRDTPAQIVQPNAKLPVRYLDCRNDAAELERTTARDLIEPFDLTDAPVMRLTLIRADEARWQVLWTVHHILLDGHSFGLLVRELVQYYRALCDGAPLPDLPLPPPFGTFLDYLDTVDLDPSRAYWRSYLSGLSAPTPLPWSPPPQDNADRKSGGDSVVRYLSAETTSALTRIAREYKVGWAAVLETAWAILVWRHTHVRDVVFGITRSDRPAELAQVADMVGLFIATVPKRLQVEPDSTALEIMQTARAATNATRDHMTIGMGEIQRQAELSGSGALFQAVVVYDRNTRNDAVAAYVSDYLGEAQWQFEMNQFTGYPLMILGFGGETLKLALEFDTALIDPAIASDWADRLAVLLDGLAEQGPESSVLDLPWQTRRDLDDHLYHWNQTTRVAGPHASIYEALSAHAEATPDHTAVISGKNRLSYAELKQAIDRLAARLQQAGVGVSDRVAVAVGRSERMIIATCAIQRVGAAYVPCDPRYPDERLSLMWTDARAHLILTEQALAGRLPASELPKLFIDETPTDILPEPAPVAIGPDTPAHVIFTSGSTGQPKGVVVTHRNVMNFLESMAERPGLTADQRILAVTTLSFDIALVELFLPLVVGATTVIADMDDVMDGRRLAELIEREAIDVIQATPTTYRLLRMAGWQPPDHCKAMVGGETLDPALAKDLRDHGGPGFELWNLYGPTETTVYCSGDPVDDGPIHIGTQTANTYYYVVDENNHLVAPGVAGELLIGGDCVAQGYFDRPALTAERFVDIAVHPEVASTRLYHSGDRVRWQRLADGRARLLICGRLDNQVKLRGFRIELGEIEAVLAAHESVEHTAVVLRHEGGDRLVAYVRLNTPTDSSVLRDYLVARLPAHMVPALFVVLDRLPTTENGKIDRNALPEPLAQRVETGARYIAPRNATERAVAGIWCEVLAVAGPGIDDNFFDIGGDSLRIVTVRGKLERQFSQPITIAELFRHATIRQLAERLNPTRPPPGDDLDETIDSRAAKRRTALARGPRGARR